MPNSELVKKCEEQFESNYYRIERNEDEDLQIAAEMFESNYYRIERSAASFGSKFSPAV